MKLPKSFLSLVQHLTIMPGIGKKSAQRIALHLLQQKPAETIALADGLHHCLSNVVSCAQCRGLSELPSTLCSICLDEHRDLETICVTESLSDLLAIEQTSVFKGRYFILRGKLSPIDRIGPEELGIPTLLQWIQKDNIQELILATSSTVEGNSTAQYIAELCAPLQVRLSRLATGIPVGSDFEYLNQHTLYGALENRTLWKEV